MRKINKVKKAEYDRKRNAALKAARGPSAIGRRPVHGMTKTAAYRHWLGVISRCGNTTNKAYKDYGGRGIYVCERWRDFSLFHADMGEKPQGMFLDRIDNDGPYSPDNCRWATPKQSANNRRNSRLVTLNGKTQTLTEWCDELGLPYQRIRNRVYVLRWADADALTAPLHTKVKHYESTETRKEVTA